MVSDNDIIIPIPVELWSRICYAYIAAYYKHIDDLSKCAYAMPLHFWNWFTVFINQFKYSEDIYSDIYYCICDYFTLDKLNQIDENKQFINVSMNDLHYIKQLITDTYSAKSFDNIVYGKDICV
jgi:hypothetical protein